MFCYDFNEGIRWVLVGISLMWLIPFSIITTKYIIEKEKKKK